MIDINKIPSYKIELTENGKKSIMNLLEKGKKPEFHIDATTDQNGCALWIKPEIYTDNKSNKKKEHTKSKNRTKSKDHTKNKNNANNTADLNTLTEITLLYRLSAEYELQPIKSTNLNDKSENNHIINFTISQKFQNLYFNIESIKIDAKGLSGKKFRIIKPKPIIKNVCISE